MKTFIKLDFIVAGLHYWENAVKQVEFLKYPHRHDFHIKVLYEVTDPDREKEIFIQTEIVENYLVEAYGYPCNFEGMSCEMIAREILQFGMKDGMVEVEVLEDGKGGSIVKI